MGKKPEELGGEGLGERQAGQGVPSNQSGKMPVPPPITLALLFGWAFLSFPLREVELEPSPGSPLLDQAATARTRGQRRIVGETRGRCVPTAVPQWPSVSPPC